MSLCEYLRLSVEAPARLLAVKGIRPVTQPAELYSRKNATELRLAYEKCIVFQLRLPIIVVDVRCNAVIQSHGEERPEWLGSGNSSFFDKSRGCIPVPRVHNRVLKCAAHCHHYPS